jgi:hypothetical protein
MTVMVTPDKAMSAELFWNNGIRKYQGDKHGGEEESKE